MERTRISEHVDSHLEVLPNDAVISIIAGAGTGKTHNLTKRYVALLKNDPSLLPEEIVVLTFTDKAATEMRARIVYAVTHDTDLQTRFTRLEMSAARISTFHVFAAQLALRHSIACDLSVQNPFVDEEQTVTRLAALWEHFVSDSGESSLIAGGADRTTVDWSNDATLALLSGILQDARGRAVEPAAFDATLGPPAEAQARVYQVTLQYLYGAYARSLEADGQLDLDDLIRIAPSLLRMYPDERASIKAIMLDEFQDTSPPQDVLMRAMTPGNDRNSRARFVVGDPRQSIYLWRNAQPENLRLVDAETPAGQQFSLLKNYRSQEPILQIANKVIDAYDHGAGGAFDPTEILIPACSDQFFDNDQRPDTVLLQEFPDEASEATAVVARILHLQTHGVALGKTAILVRNRAHAQVFIDALARAGIPCDDGILTTFYGKPLILDAIHTLLAAADPYNERSLTRTVWQACRIWDETALAAARAAHQKTALWEILRRERSQPAVVQFVQALGAAHHTRLTTPPMLWAQSVLQSTGVWQRDGAYGMRMLTRFLEIVCRDARTVGELVTVLKTAPHSATNAETPELQTDTNAVRIMTVHTAKGLEFEAVFVVNAHEFRYRDPIGDVSYKSGTLRFDKKADEYAAFRTQTKNEVVTLFYVALTRARRWLWVSSPTHTDRTRHFFQLCAFFTDNPAPGITVRTDVSPLPASLASARTTNIYTAPPLVERLSSKPIVALTPSTLAELVECPQRFRFLRRSGLDRLLSLDDATPAAADAPPMVPTLAVALGDPPSSAAAVELPDPEPELAESADARQLGTLFHRVCELHVLTPQHDAATLVAAACAHQDADISAPTRAELLQLTERFLTSPLGSATAGVAVERRISWEWEREAAVVRFSGVIDRYDGTTITDYKTDTDLDGLAERHGNQLRLYGLALAEGVPAEMPELALFHARSATVVPVDTSAAAIAATYAALDRALAVVVADEYPAQPSARCHGCPALARCDAGKRFVRNGV